MNVPPDEKLTHFIFSQSNFSVEKQEVKYGAFIPPKKNPKEISVYRVSSLTENQVWEIGEKYVQRGERRLKARADFLAAVVYENNLKVIPDTEPHELHANIIPIPVDKEDRNEVLRELASASELVLIPTE